MRTRILALVLTTLASQSSEPSLTVYPRIILVGNGVRVTCRVPRDPSNRRVRWGFTDWRSSTREMEGDESPITWETTFNQVPCEPGPAFCEVIRAGKKGSRVEVELEVKGCERAEENIRRRP